MLYVTWKAYFFYLLSSVFNVKIRSWIKDIPLLVSTFMFMKTETTVQTICSSLCSSEGFKFLCYLPVLVWPGTTPPYLLSWHLCFWAQTLKSVGFDFTFWFASLEFKICGCTNSFFWERQKTDSHMNGEFCSNLMSENNGSLFSFPV